MPVLRARPVVRFVDDHQVPASGEQSVLGLLVFDQPLQRHQRELGVFERVAGVAFDEALRIEQRHLQVEAPTHFHQPLMLQVFRHRDQHAAGAPAEQLAMDHQACFDGLAQAYFVGQQYPWRNAVSHFTGDVQLVRDRLGAAAAQTPQGREHLFAGVLQGVVAQGEPRQRVDLPGEQAVAGQTELDEVGQLGLRQDSRLVLAVEAVVDQKAIGVLDLAHGQLPTLEMSDLVARREAHAGQRRIAQEYWRVSPVAG